MRLGGVLGSQKGISRTNDDTTIRSRTHAPRFNESFARQRQVDDPPLDGRHRIEGDGMLGRRDASRGIACQTFEELHAAQPISVHVDKTAALDRAQFLAEEKT